MLVTCFELYEKEAARLAKVDLPLPAYGFVLKCSHTFNVLDARGALSVTERTRYIDRVRELARRCAHKYLAGREADGFSLLPDPAEQVAA